MKKRGGFHASSAISSPKCPVESKHHKDQEKDHYVYGEFLYLCDQEVQHAFLSPVKFREADLDEELGELTVGCACWDA
jgi:hypothetical protein